MTYIMKMWNFLYQSWTLFVLVSAYYGRANADKSDNYTGMNIIVSVEENNTIAGTNIVVNAEGNDTAVRTNIVVSAEEKDTVSGTNNSISAEMLDITVGTNVAVSIENDTAAESNIVRTFDDVPLADYGTDVCKPIARKMPDFRAPGRRISEVKCFEYSWKSKLASQEQKLKHDCFRLKNPDTYPILGGRDAYFGEFAHMGALGWKATMGSWIFKCGTSLISEKFSLTAAHCSSTRISDETVADSVPKIVRLGAATLFDQEDVDRFWRWFRNPEPKAVRSNSFPDSYRPIDVNIKRIIVHPEYRSPRHYYDIALIEFHEEAPFIMIVHPACMHHTSQVPVDATVAGWGIIDLATRKIPPTLQTADVSIINNTDCDKMLHVRRNRRWWGIADHQICAGNLTGDVDTCEGDSGGPLAEPIPQRDIKTELTGPDKAYKWRMNRIIGVTSFGYQCGRPFSPSVYVRVSSFIDWIESIVWPAE